MKYYRCKCGNRESRGSMPPPRCMGCEKCGTNLALSPRLHHSPEPHKWTTDSVDTDLGPQPITRCLWCDLPKVHSEPHYHAAKYIDGKLVDICARCGLDLRDPIHKRGSIAGSGTPK